MSKRTITDVGFPLSGEEWFVGEVAKLLARAGLLQQIYEIREEDLGKACFDVLQEADSYLLKHSDGMMLAALPCADGSIRFACLLKAGIMDCWIVITEQAPNSPLREAISVMIDDLLESRLILPDYQL
jgi:hypothetical protein